jgi:hypothetical protein
VAQPTGERSILGFDLIWRTGDTIAYVDQSQWSNRASDALQQIWRRRSSIKAASAPPRARVRRARIIEIRWEVLDFEVQRRRYDGALPCRRSAWSAGAARLLRRALSTRTAPVASARSSRWRPMRLRAPPVKAARALGSLRQMQR